MLTIAKLFGKSPFAPLQTHMDKVTKCIEKLPMILEAAAKGEEKKVEDISAIISKLEHEADLTKNDIRNHLPKSLFLPIDRSDLLEILSLQDSIADKAEDICILLTLRKLPAFDRIGSEFLSFANKNIETCLLARKVIKEMDELLESSFGGLEAAKVKAMVEQIALQEHELDKLQYQITKHLYSFGDTLPPVSFHLWTTLIREVGSLSNYAEKLGDHIRMILEIS